MDVDVTVRVVAIIGEFALNVSGCTFEVSSTTDNSVEASESGIRVWSFPRELARASIQILVCTFAQPHITLVNASAEFIVQSDIYATNLVLHGSGECPSLTCVHRGVLNIDHGTIWLNQWSGPFLRRKKVKYSQFASMLKSVCSIFGNQCSYLNSIELGVSAERLGRNALSLRWGRWSRCALALVRGTLTLVRGTLTLGTIALALVRGALTLGTIALALVRGALALVRSTLALRAIAFSLVRGALALGRRRCPLSFSTFGPVIVLATNSTKPVRLQYFLCETRKRIYTYQYK